MKRTTFTLAGKEYAPRYDFEALCLMSERHGLNALSETAFIPNPTTVAILVWGAVQYINPNLSLKNVWTGLELSEMKHANSLCIDALVAALPKKSDDETVGAT